jgi:hypothetical protein
MESYLQETFDIDGNLVSSETIEIEIPETLLSRRAAIAEYKNATQLLLSSNVAATTKSYVRANTRILKAIVEELQDLEV